MEEPEEEVKTLEEAPVTQEVEKSSPIKAIEEIPTPSTQANTVVGNDAAAAAESFPEPSGQPE